MGLDRRPRELLDGSHASTLLGWRGGGDPDRGPDQAVPVGHRARPPRRDRRRGGHRAGRRQRRRQVHADQDPARPGPRDRAARRRCSATTWRPTAARSGRSSATCPSTTASRPTSPPATWSCTWARCPGCRTPRRASAPPTCCGTSAWPRSATGPMGGYSTGMKQRAKLAQAIVHDPRLVLLDEPTNGLDPSSRDDMLALVQRIGHEFGISVLVTSHLLGELERVSDHVVVLDGGRLLRSSATTEFLHATGSLVVEVQGRPDADRLLGQALVEAGLVARPARRRADRGGGAGRDHARRRTRPDRRPRSRPGADAGAAPPDRGRVPGGGGGQCPAGLRRRPPAGGAGVIHDLGYRPYSGPRLGEGPVAWAFFLTGLRNAYGLGRSGRSKVLPMMLLGDDAAAGAHPDRGAGPGPRPARPRPADRRLLDVPDHHAAADLGLRRRPGADPAVPRPAVPDDHPLPGPADAAVGLRPGAGRLADRGDLRAHRRTAAADVRRRPARRPARRPRRPGKFLGAPGRGACCWPPACPASRRWSRR